MTEAEKYGQGAALVGLIQLILLIVAWVKHDWFILAFVYVLNTNVIRVINYHGDKEDGGSL